MNLREQIEAMTLLKNSEEQNYTTTKKNVEKKNIGKQCHEIGERPCSLEGYDKNYSKTHSKKKKKSKKQLLIDKHDSSSEKNESRKKYKEIPSNLHEIENSLRMIHNFGCQSNEIIEKRHKEQQLALKIDKIKNSDSPTTDSSYSMDTTDSYSHDIKDLCDLINTNNLDADTVSEDSEFCRYRKNALITSLLRTNENDYSELDSSVTVSSEGLLDSSEIINDSKVIINSDNEQKSMYDFRINKLLESEELKDVYYHPLVERIQKDPEWKNLVLQRKGIETTHSSREYFMNIDNDSFTFVSK